MADATVASKSFATRRLRPSPGEEPLDHPTTRHYGEAHLIRQLTHNLDDNARGIGHPLPGIGSVGKYSLDEGEPAAGCSQQWHRAVAILHVGGADLQQQRSAIGVDQCMTLAALDLLGSVKPARSAGLGGLDTLAVHHRGAGVASRPTLSRSSISR